MNNKIERLEWDLQKAELLTAAPPGNLPHGGSPFASREAKLRSTSVSTGARSPTATRLRDWRPSCRSTPRRDRGGRSKTQWSEIAPPEFWPKPVVRDWYPKPTGRWGTKRKTGSEVPAGFPNCMTAGIPTTHFRRGVLRSAGLLVVQQQHLLRTPYPLGERRL